MAGWHEFALAGVACLGVAGAVMADESVPVDRAENTAPSRVRAGLVAAEPGGAVTLGAVEAAVLADAARAWRLGDLKALKVSVEDVTWADGSLGCPRPGMAYTQALVPGWRLVVRDTGREATYHASRRGQWLWCAAGRMGLPPSGDATR